MSSELDVIAERYILEEPIAHGGMATVWKARDEVLARTVAVKILHSHLTHDEVFLERFDREALAAAHLTHPKIVAIYDTGRDGDRHFIVMEHCSRGTLEQVVEAQAPVSAERAVAIVVDILEALGYAHTNGVVHRDVKPANVMIAEDGTLKVADFGIAKAAFAAGNITTTGSILGTVTYISPEQARGGEPDARSDLYSAGIVLYELLVGRPPFAAETPVGVAMKHLQEKPAPPRSIRAGIPKWLDGVVLRALSKDPDTRFSSAEEMAAALGRAHGHVGAPLRSPADEGERATVPARERSGTLAEYRWFLPVVALVGLALALVFLVSALEDEPDTPAPREAGDSPRSRNPIEIVAAEDFDPYGDQVEHPNEVGLAHDGSAATAWQTESYSAPFQLQDKPGVGLLFDLGPEAEVGRVKVRSNDPGYSLELRAGNRAGAQDTAFELVDRVPSAAASESLSFDPVAARYWVVWITRLPATTGGRASIAEVRFFAS